MNFKPQSMGFAKVALVKNTHFGNYGKKCQKYYLNKSSKKRVFLQKLKYAQICANFKEFL